MQQVARIRSLASLVSSRARGDEAWFFRRLAKQHQTRTSLLLAKKYFSSTPRVQPIIELRECTVHPEHMAEYMDATADTAELRKSLSPLRFFSLPETGGPLLVPTHAYYYQGGHAERNQANAKAAQHPEWKQYLETTAPYLQTMQSNIYVEAPLTEMMIGLEEVSPLLQLQQGSPESSHGGSILEIRRYHLQLGYDTVPQFLEYYRAGLPSKLAAVGNDPTTSLVTLLYTEVGRLNEVIEIWRHGNGTDAMERSRVAARGASEWRTAIAKIAHLAIQFTSTIHRPSSFSPLQ